MSEQRVVVMGLGNLLWADEGFGVRVAERLYAHYHWPDEVEIVDGGTQGLNLLGYVESASHLLILDACNQVNHLIPTRVLVKGGEITCKILK